MPWIQNCAVADIPVGSHKFDFGHTVLIRIFDPASAYRPAPEKEFNAIYEFEFLDIEDEDNAFAIDRTQSNKIARILKDCLRDELNVVVHCYAGVCRSGAVCEAGVMMGFEDTEVYRQPNVLVKTYLLSSLGLLIDPTTSVFAEATAIKD